MATTCSPLRMRCNTVKDGSLIAVQPNKDDLMSQILSPDNLNRAYLQVVRNKGVGGVDRMRCV